MLKHKKQNKKRMNLTLYQVVQARENGGAVPMVMLEVVRPGYIWKVKANKIC